MGYWSNKMLQDYREVHIKVEHKGQDLSTKYAVSHDRTTDNQKTICVEAAFNDDTLSYATGFVIYDPEGKMMAAGYHKINPPGSVLNAELYAIANGLDFGMNNVEGPWRILTDSLDAFHAIRSENSYKGLEEDILQKLRTQFRNSQVFGVWHYKRSLNICAHELAKTATKSPQPQA